MGVVNQHVCRTAPEIASGAVVVTLLTCLIIAKINHVYTGGLAWPYFSDLGRDSPGYYVFCVGLTIVSITLSTTWHTNYQFQRAVLKVPTQLGYVSRSVEWMSTTCTVIGVLSTLGLPILEGFVAAVGFLQHVVVSVAAQCCRVLVLFAGDGRRVLKRKLAKTFASYRILRSAELLENTAGGVPVICDDEDIDPIMKFSGLKRTFRIQAVFSAFFFVAFLLYFPIGLSIIKPFQRLTIRECLDRDLGEVYCKGTIRYDHKNTKLWNYENDYTSTQMRAAAQLACILSLVGYSMSFLTHNVAVSRYRERVATFEASTGIQTNTHFCAIPLLSPVRDSTSEFQPSTSGMSSISTP